MSKTRILVVDDNRPIAKLVAMRLEQTGLYDVRVEYMPSEAASVAREFQPDVFLLDVDMPGISGPELARSLKTDPRLSSTPVIFLTSLISGEEAGDRELISNGNRYLSKSATTEVVQQCVQRALSEAPKCN